MYAFIEWYCWDYFNVKCAESSNRDAEVCETAEAEIADLKMQLIALENDVSHQHVFSI